MTTRTLLPLLVWLAACADDDGVPVYTISAAGTCDWSHPGWDVSETGSRSADGQTHDPGPGDGVPACAWSKHVAGQGLDIQLCEPVVAVGACVDRVGGGPGAASVSSVDGAPVHDTMLYARRVRACPRIGAAPQDAPDAVCRAGDAVVSVHYDNACTLGHDDFCIACAAAGGDPGGGFCADQGLVDVVLDGDTGGR